MQSLSWNQGRELWKEQTRAGRTSYGRAASNGQTQVRREANIGFRFLALPFIIMSTSLACMFYLFSGDSLSKLLYVIDFSLSCTPSKGYKLFHFSLGLNFSDQGHKHTRVDQMSVVDPIASYNQKDHDMEAIDACG
jgi:hypothetical protein